MFLQLSLSPGVEYTVLIDDGVGPTVRESVSSPSCNSTHCSHTYYPGEGSRAEFGVTVEAAGCVTRQTVCQESPVCEWTQTFTSSITAPVIIATDCPVRDLSPSLVEVNRVCGSVSGGGVCYSGDSVGSVAVFFCDDGYTLEGGDSTRECLSSGLWNGTTPQCVQKRDGTYSYTTQSVDVCNMFFLP